MDSPQPGGGSAYGHAIFAARLFAPEMVNRTRMGAQENVMTSNMDIVKAWNDAGSSAAGIGASAAYLAEDFQSVDQNGDVIMDKPTFVGMGSILEAAFDGFRFARADLREEGDFVIMTGHFEGTHVADLDLSAMGLGVIPASGRRIVWPDNTVRITVRDGQIVREEPYGEGGGVEAFLAPLLAAGAAT